MKIGIYVFLLLMTLQAHALTPHVRCQVQLLKLTTDALYAEMAKKNWDATDILNITFNYGLPGRDRTVFQCSRKASPHNQDEYCLIEVFTQVTNSWTAEKNKSACPKYQVADLISNCSDQP